MFLVAMGVAGCGKSSVGRALAEALDLAFLEGDAFHPPANVAKMRAGTALTDADREPWLQSLAATIAEYQARGEPGLVLACSALKRSYRDALRRGCDELTFLFLEGPRDLIAERMTVRTDHYMPLSLLDSQFATLQIPAADERSITVNIDRPLADIVAAARSSLETYR